MIGGSSHLPKKGQFFLVEKISNILGKKEVNNFFFFFKNDINK